jgi:hypothetical protein
MNAAYLVSVPTYPKLLTMLGRSAANWGSSLNGKVIPYLVERWLSHYDLASSGGEIVEVPAGKDSYLFDIGPDRLIAAWAISQGRFAGERDHSRMKGFPVACRGVYHAGHAIPHRLGGGTDINLVAQLGKVNTGSFRTLENKAVKTPGALYFTYWIYGSGPGSQRPARVQQGLLICGHRPEITVFTN